MDSRTVLVDELLEGLGDIECTVEQLAAILAGLLKQAPLPVWIYDRNGKVVYNNLSSIRWGSGGNELGNTIDNNSPQVRAILRQGLERCLATQHPVSQEGWVNSDVFGISYLKFDFMPLPGSLVACAPYDLTENKRVELALHESEERVQLFAEILERALMPFGAAYPDGRLTMVNRAFCQLTGYDEEQLQEISFFEELTAGEAFDNEQRVLRAMAQTGLPQRYEKLIPRADGTEVPVEVFMQQITNEQGIARSIFFFVTDITDRYRVRQALQHSEERLALALEGAADGIWDYDPTTQTIFRSSWMTELLGYSTAELTPDLDSWLRIVHPDDLDTVKRAWEAHLAGETAQYMTEHRLQCKSGDWLWVLDSGKVVQRDSAGRPLRVVGTHKNITERKRIEEQLIREHKEQTLTTLAGGIAHDFNNILMGILGTASLLQEVIPPDDPSAELCALISTSAQRMADLTSKLLAYARGGAFQPQTIDPGVIAMEALGMVRTSVAPHIELCSNLHTGLWPVLADAGQLLQVLLNLLVNASEAIGDEAGRITLSAGNVGFGRAWQDNLGLEHPPGEYVRICVADSGCGMDDKTVRAIFEPFFSTKSRGRGLGLAAVTGIIGQHRGGIRVASQPHSGSSFEIYLPRAASAPAAEHKDPLSATQGQETILIVDDDTTVLVVVKAMLEHLGYRVLTAGNPEECFELFRTHRDRIALAVIDVHLEHANGHQVLAQLRDERQDLPAIISSGFSAEQAFVQTKRDTRTDFVQKPYETAVLARRIRAILDACALDAGLPQHWVKPPDSAT
jgi:PAS domain S-box-containing protein